MKRMIIVLAVAAASVAAFGQPPKPDSSPASYPKPKYASAFVAASSSTLPLVKKEQSRVQITTPLSILKPEVTRKIQHVGRLSSEPWAQMVGMRPGWSAFPRPEMENPSMPLITINFGPVH